MPPRNDWTKADLIERWEHIDLSSLSIDERDVRILVELVNDSRKSNLEIAKELGVTEGTVRRRIGKMERSGLIRGYSTVIDFSLMESPVKAYIAVKTDGEARLDIARHFSQHPRCVAVYETSGDHDMMAVMVFTSASECKEFTEKHLKSEGVKAMTVQVVSSAYKGSVWSSS